MPDQLKQTIYPASGRDLQIGVQGGFVDEDRTATIPEMKDGNDATYESLHHSGQGAQGPLSVSVYSWTMDTLSYGGPISFVKIRMRQRITLALPTFPNGCNFCGHFNGFGPGIYSPYFYFDSLNSYLWTEQTMPTNPQTSAAWTAAAINAGKFGHRIDDEADSFTDYITYLSEFAVEVWGPGEEQAPAGVLRSKGPRLRASPGRLGR